MSEAKAFKWALLLGMCLAVSFACVAHPLYVIRPFRRQGARELAVALWVSRWRLWAIAACALAAAGAALLYWRSQPRLGRRITAVAGALAVLVFAALCRVNVYEIMFHPLDHPSFSAASQSKLNGGEMVIAVRSGPDARAYPIRVLSYHHIVNDTLGGVPIAATY